MLERDDKDLEAEACSRAWKEATWVPPSACCNLLLFGGALRHPFESHLHSLTLTGGIRRLSAAPGAPGPLGQLGRLAATTASSGYQNSALSFRAPLRTAFALIRKQLRFTTLS